MTTRRVAGAPISWGVCELPDWGLQLRPERVLGEMASLGLRATELGPVGYLPLDPQPLSACLQAFELRLVGGFVPLVLHQPELRRTRERAARMAALLAASGAEVFVAAILADEEWSVPAALSAADWDRLVSHLSEVDDLVAAEGLRLAVHPHMGTLVERDVTVQQLLADSDTGWCLDTGHMLVGGTDPVDFVRRNGGRIVHVHLKDVNADIAASLRARELSLVEATKRGLFRALGEGDARIAEVLRALDEVGYEHWFVLEQDTAITGQEPPDGDGPVLDVKRSIEYLMSLAPEREVAQR